MKAAIIILLILAFTLAAFGPTWALAALWAMALAGLAYEGD